MNIALCMSGHLRTIKSCYSSHYDNLLSVLAPDIFIHTWDHSESSTSSWHTQHTYRLNTEEHYKEFLQTCYSPCELSIEKEIAFNLPGNQPGTKLPLDGLKSMTYSMKRSYDMMREYSKKNNKKYDFIIRIRPDIMLHRNFLTFYHTGLLMYGNKTKQTHMLYRGKDINYSALDCLFVEHVNSTDQSAFEVDNSFIDHYNSQNCFHSPFVDYIASKEIEAVVNSSVHFGRDWSIKRNPKR